MLDRWRALRAFLTIGILGLQPGCTPAQRPAGPGPVVSPGETLAFEFDNGLPAGSAILLGGFSTGKGGAPGGRGDACATVDGEGILQLAERRFGPVQATAYVKIERVSTGPAGLVLRGAGCDSGYLFALDAKVGRIGICLLEPGRRVALAERSASVGTGIWHEVRALALGDVLQIELDGRLLAEAQDGRIAAGAPALWAGPGSRACFAGPRFAAR